ncbi:hypothetical protein HPP92_027255, partial [Vanilla planifolia]
TIHVLCCTSTAPSYQSMHRVLLPFFIALMVTPSTHSLEGTLLAFRDLRFLSLSMAGCFCFGGLFVMVGFARLVGSIVVGGFWNSTSSRPVKAMVYQVVGAGLQYSNG